MSSRKLRIIQIEVKECQDAESGLTTTRLHIEFSRKLNQLEIAGIETILNDGIK